MNEWYVDCSVETVEISTSALISSHQQRQKRRRNVSVPATSLRCHPIKSKRRTWCFSHFLRRSWPAWKWWMDFWSYSYSYEITRLGGIWRENGIKNWATFWRSSLWCACEVLPARNSTNINWLTFRMVLAVSKPLFLAWDMAWLWYQNVLFLLLCVWQSQERSSSSSSSSSSPSSSSSSLSSPSQRRYHKLDRTSDFTMIATPNLYFKRPFRIFQNAFTMVFITVSSATLWFLFIFRSLEVAAWIALSTCFWARAMLAGVQGGPRVHQTKVLSNNNNSGLDYDIKMTTVIVIIIINNNNSKE